MENETILQICEQRFCAFCGNEISPNEHGDYQCQCPDAKEYRKALSLKLQLDFEASKVMANAPKPKYGLSTVCVPLQELEPCPDKAAEDEPNMCW